MNNGGSMTTTAASLLEALGWPPALPMPACVHASNAEKQAARDAAVKELCSRLAAVADPVQLSAAVSAVLGFLTTDQQDEADAHADDQSSSHGSPENAAAEAHPLTAVFVQRCSLASAFYPPLAQQTPAMLLGTLMPMFRIIFHKYIRAGEAAYFDLGEVFVRACCASILSHPDETPDTSEELIKHVCDMAFSWKADPSALLHIHAILTHFSTLQTRDLLHPRIQQAGLRWLSQLPRGTHIPTALFQHVTPTTTVTVDARDIEAVSTLLLICHPSSLAPALDLCASLARGVDALWLSSSLGRIECLAMMIAAATRGLAHERAPVQSAAAKIVQRGLALITTALPTAHARAHEQHQQQQQRAGVEEGAVARGAGQMARDVLLLHKWPGAAVLPPASSSKQHAPSVRVGGAVLLCFAARECGVLAAADATRVMRAAEEASSRAMRGGGSKQRPEQASTNTSNLVHMLCTCFALKHTSCAHLRVALCHTLPALSTTTAAAHITHRVAMSIARDDLTKPLAISMLHSLSDAHLQFRPSLYRLLIDETLTAKSTPPLTHTLARAHALVKLTMHPQRPSVQVLLPVAHAHLQSPEPSVQAMALRSIANLCTTDRLDPRSTLRALSSWLDDCGDHPLTTAAACHLFGAVHNRFDELSPSEHEPESADFDDPERRAALDWLWDKTAASRPLSVRRAAYINLARFHPSCIRPLHPSSSSPSPLLWAPLSTAMAQQILADVDSIVAVATAPDGLITRALAYEASQLPRSVLVRWQEGKHAPAPTTLATAMAGNLDAADSSLLVTPRLTWLRHTHVQRSTQSISRHLTTAGLMLSHHAALLPSLDATIGFAGDCLRTARCGDGVDALVLGRAWLRVAGSIAHAAAVSEDEVATMCMRLVSAAQKRPAAHVDVNTAALVCALAVRGAVPTTWRVPCTALCAALLGDGRMDTPPGDGTGGAQAHDDIALQLAAVCRHLAKRRSATMREIAAFFLPLLGSPSDSEALSPKAVEALMPVERVIVHAQRLANGGREHGIDLLIHACAQLDGGKFDSMWYAHVLAFAADAVVAAHKQQQQGGKKRSGAVDAVRACPSFAGTTAPLRLLVWALQCRVSAGKRASTTSHNAGQWREMRSLAPVAARVLAGWTADVGVVGAAWGDCNEDDRVSVAVGVHCAECGQQPLPRHLLQGLSELSATCLQHVQALSPPFTNATLAAVVLVMDTGDLQQSVELQPSRQPDTFVPPVLRAVMAAERDCRRPHHNLLAACFPALPPRV
ncbi:hypothetical protein PTSG_05096 [Salpingoeca rosetta]|uniref:DUF3730 domain-containing protein n=1 Tax=Salpingoeca rosetta (strain ATCC 50818 / BSB-021) TaxID=946362 RepID=F2UAI5_SALR5|nr:uncharacterized protein PTSG_05096 [Salpingoeca rosetta]EGD73401.1 hypothetical protein PTSG_05096 [Salpingoeca rosetta]|eukprot:XP_004993683.1 hypothetical protein PTSG_05096 [Salpingoeca rosetta]